MFLGAVLLFFLLYDIEYSIMEPGGWYPAVDIAEGSIHQIKRCFLSKLRSHFFGRTLGTSHIYCRGLLPGNTIEDIHCRAPRI